MGIGKIANLVKLLFRFVPEGALTVVGGFGTLLTGVASLTCEFSGLCQSNVSTEAAVGMITAGAGLIGLGRRKK